jgi:hypothetical protein
MLAVGSETRVDKMIELLSDKCLERVRVVGKSIVYAAVVIYLLELSTSTIRSSPIQSDLSSQFRQTLNSVEFASRSIIAQGHTRPHGNEGAFAPARNRTRS